MNDNKLRFISNNVKGIQANDKRIKLFEYLRKYVIPNGFVFLQETHSTENDEKQWEDEFKGQLFFSHGKSNSCGVAIGFYGAKKLELLNKCSDKAGRILLLDVKIDDTVFVLVNIYNANTENDQLQTLSDLNDILGNINDIETKNIILGGDFNVFFNLSLEANGGNPVLKKKSIAKLIQLKEKFSLCDIWRIRSPKVKRFTFRQHHKSGFIQRRLDYFFISNNIQENVKDSDILAAFSTDHSPVIFSMLLNKDKNRGKGLWKFNNSLTANDEFVDKMKIYIKDILENMDKENIIDEQLRWEFLKYEIRKFSIIFSKNLAKIKKIETSSLESKLNLLETTEKFDSNSEYIECKNKLEQIYTEKANGIRIRSKCDWYEYGEKSSKFFLNLEKSRANQSKVRNICKNNNEITEQKEINQELFNYYKDLFTEKLKISKTDINNYLSDCPIPQLSEEQTLQCEENFSEKEFYQALINMPNNKSPGNDRLTKEFYETFWGELKTPLISSFECAFIKDELSSSQKQAVIKLIEKLDRDKRFIKNWRPISLLNVDTKIISKVLSGRIKEVLPSLISSNQTAYVDGRIISESGRLISDILEITDLSKQNRILLTIDIEKAFDSVNHAFLISVLEKYGFGKNFLKWINVLLNNQESCVINGGFTTQYFKLERGTRQGDPISAYLFVLVLEIVFLLIQENKKIHGLNIFNHTLLYTAYADDTTFFLSNKQSVTEVIKVFEQFSLFSGLKPNKSKCEVAGIGALKGVSVALCGMECIDLTTKTIKILGIHFSYNNNVKNNENFMKHIRKIEQVLKLWRMRYLSIEGKITVFKTLALSKIIHLALVTDVPKSTILALNKIQKEFIWKNSNPKIKHSTLCSNYEKGGLKNVDITSKIISLQCSWIKRLFDKSAHCWKVIPLHLIKTYLGDTFRFHSNLEIPVNKIKTFPIFYKQIFRNWSTKLSAQPTLPSTIASQVLWYNKYIKVDNKSIYNCYISKKKINYIAQFFGSAGNLKTWEVLKEEYQLNENKKFAFIQIIHAIPKSWKENLASTLENIGNLVVQDHHLIQKNQVYILNKLTSKKIYDILISASEIQPTSQNYYQEIFQTANLDWKIIYTLPRIVTLDTKFRIFQYKLLNNVLYLNKMLFKFGKSNSPHCSFCKKEEETPLHLFYECSKTSNLWIELQLCLENKILLPSITPQNAIFGFIDITENKILLNHLLLIFKFYLYNARKTGNINIENLKASICNIKNFEREISKDNPKKTMKYKKKWHLIPQVM